MRICTSWRQLRSAFLAAIVAGCASAANRPTIASIEQVVARLPVGRRELVTVSGPAVDSLVAFYNSIGNGWRRPLFDGPAPRVLLEFRGSGGVTTLGVGPSFFRSFASNDLPIRKASADEIRRVAAMLGIADSCFTDRHADTATACRR